MKARKYGKKYQITYRCPNYPKIINETFDTEEQANLRIAQVKLEKKLGTLTPPARFLDPERDLAQLRKTMTVEQLMREFVNIYGLNHWSEGTLSCNRHRIDDYIIPYIGDIPIKDLTTRRLEQFYLQLQSEPAVKMKGREDEENTVSISVIEKIHALMRSALNQAIRWDYFRGANPALTVELPKQKKKSREIWDDDKAHQALAVCDDPILKLCMYLALGCSMRIGEILGLTWDCVHIDEDLVESGKAYLLVEKELRRCDKQSVDDLKSHGRSDIFLIFPSIKKSQSTTLLVLKTPKTESSVRSIFIPKTVALALKAAREQQSDVQAALGGEYQDFNLVVAQNNGRPYEERLIAQKLRAFIAEHDLKPVVFHSLRHSSTSVKLRISGGNIKAVQEDTGHAQANMVTDVYAHSMTNDREALAQEMDAQFFSTGSQGQGSPPPAPTSESARKVMELMEKSPDIADLLLQMTQVLSNNKS